MFTGLVQESARVVRNLESSGASNAIGLVLESCKAEFFALPLGSSVAVNGVCLTLTKLEPSADTQSVRLFFDVSKETLSRSNLGALTESSFVHLELPLNLGSPLGGHLVSGHVDGMCEVLSSEEVGDYLSINLRLSGETRKKIAPFMVEKGSIALDGVSLTVNKVEDSALFTDFEIMLIPHTLSLTWPDGLVVGRKINVEADLMAKHFVRYQMFQSLEKPLPKQSVESNVSFV